MANVIDDAEGIAIYTGNLSAIALEREEWQKAEALARQTIPLSEKLGRLELVAEDCHRLAKAIARQGKASEAIPYAQRSVELYTHLGSPGLEAARATLVECRLHFALERLNHGWTYNTTALEGNTLNLSEVDEVLDNPAAVIVNRPAEHVAETRAQGAALKLLAEYLQAGRDWTNDDLFRLHTVLMQGSTVDSFKPIGTWKIEDNGTPIKLDVKLVWNDAYATAREVPALMETWLDELNRRREGNLDPFEDYLFLHATFARIHPFADGNGRMTRLLANLPLLAAGLNPVDIPAAARDRYLEALARWQIACGPPRPNDILWANPELLADFRTLCASSRVPDRECAGARIA